MTRSTSVENHSISQISRDLRILALKANRANSDFGYVEVKTWLETLKQRLKRESPRAEALSLL
ncbi:MAG: hypothetical protein K1X83_03135 [Oligoflexia bacterium]|nr:hypothetical protein [Oligoflexia bacterium]